MSGEKSKKSGEIGEVIASELLKKIGWKHQIQNISIECNDGNHKNKSDNQKRSHGDDIVYLYHNPFHDDTTTVCHISVKHSLGGYPKSEQQIRKNFNPYIKELEQIIQCARYNTEVNSFIEAFDAKVNIKHIGVLIWLHNDKDSLDRNILPAIAKSKPDLEEDIPYYIIDSSRASFLLDIINDLIQKSNGGTYEFYYPRIGTSILIDTSRHGQFLPIELIASDIITAIITIGDKKQFYLYSREGFGEETCRNMMAYALDFSAGLVGEICIGFPDFNSTKDKDIVTRARLSFKDRSEDIRLFSYHQTILDLF
ncbi:MULTISPECIES: GapS4a family protein [unclassified Avibacterium]|uniref:GapS4a family protein n=1 Tax=unclassified Avibacterium TaxID=2685287 RepID=UPI002026D9C1|nr:MULTISPECIES: hypothetical protein [unclassified Avibacterium]MCW9699107.1 hypothetical protein [Avibacterium sp. 20-129]URL06700.1 hypothetical protein L4F92_00805 [Avibacterium sp. 21-595]